MEWGRDLPPAGPRAQCQIHVFNFSAAALSTSSIGALGMEEELQAPAAAEEPKAADRMEDADEHLPSEVGDHGRGEAMEPDAPAIAANPEELPPSVECEDALEEAEPAEAPDILEGPEECLPSEEGDYATDPNAG
jgi:hypothetical protein